ncbi:ATPase [Flavobacterium palustre]|uniref:ATPase n=1 Tax=Flavobacterium palustre TaxID=1476463 RepID=A0ABQ1HRS2_9FLAO|nr:ATPase [Flavobacterium palustre]GGA87526.1 ATPase [Flavobacterium palustre]
MTYYDTYHIANNTKIFEPRKCFQFLEQQGKEMFNSNFKIHSYDYPTIYKLLIYAIRDQKVALELGIDLNKGIMLSGPIGCGKTSLMHLIKPFIHQKNEYKIKTTRQISFEFAKSGYEILSQYTYKNPNQNRLTGYCFDDLGAEQQIKHFGNDCNVMAEILITRYEEFIANGSITHITTNLSASEIEKAYGNRVRSRLRQMFNLIAFDKEAKDKR